MVLTCWVVAAVSIVSAVGAVGIGAVRIVNRLGRLVVGCKNTSHNQYQTQTQQMKVNKQRGQNLRHCKHRHCKQFKLKIKLKNAASAIQTIRGKLGFGINFSAANQDHNKAQCTSADDQLLSRRQEKVARTIMKRTRTCEDLQDLQQLSNLKIHTGNGLQMYGACNSNTNAGGTGNARNAATTEEREKNVKVKVNRPRKTTTLRVGRGFANRKVTVDYSYIHDGDDAILYDLESDEVQVASPTSSSSDVCCVKAERDAAEFYDPEECVWFDDDHRERL